MSDMRCSLPSAFLHAAGGVLAYCVPVHLLHSHHTTAAPFVGARQLQGHRLVGQNYVVAVKHGKGLIFRPIFRQQQGVARAVCSLLIGKAYLGKVVQRAQLLGCVPLALLFQTAFQISVGSKVAHHVLLVAGDDYQHVFYAGGGNLLYQ